MSAEELQISIDPNRCNYPPKWFRAGFLVPFAFFFFLPRRFLGRARFSLSRIEERMAMIRERDDAAGDTGGEIVLDLMAPLRTCA